MLIQKYTIMYLIRKAIILVIFLKVGIGHTIAHEDFESRIKTAEMSGDRQQVTDLCKAWYASGTYSSGVLNWCYNALMSVESGAILITQGQYDTYPIWLLQYALMVRPDVAVFNIEMLNEADYRYKITQFDPIKAVKPGKNLHEFLSQLIGFQEHPLYYSVLSDKNRIQSDRNNLYLTGLAFRYSDVAFDNIALLKSNYESQFRKDGLNLEFSSEKDQAIVTALNLNYLPALLMLHQHYVEKNEADKAITIKALTYKIARAGNRESEMNAYYAADIIASPPIQSSISMKELEKGMKPVSNNLWAAETEVTNGQYEQFLMDLVSNKAFDALNICKTSRTDWRSLVPKEFAKLPDGELFKYGNPDEKDCPVQNISYEAAVQYCDWMTKVYNDPGEKKKFGKVVFRLPTEAEWEQAALGKALPGSAYPWGGKLFQNKKGCYLGNFNTDEPCADCYLKHESNDGGFFTVKADSYYPNDLGLYNTTGNVAEMTSEKGKAKGGSWQDKPTDCTIQSVKSFVKPDPSIGFRIFMEQE